MLLQRQKCGFSLILVFCLYDSISSSPLEQLPPHPPHRWATIVNKNTNGTVDLSSAPDANRTSVAQKAKTKLTESYLPAVMQAVAYYVELIQYEPLYTTTIEPPFSIVPPTLPTKPSYDAVSQPTSTTWKPIATTTNRPVTWWSPPSTEKPQTSTWWSPPSTTAWTTTTEKPTTSSTQRPSTTTPSWWNQQTTPFHKPGYFAPESLSNFNDKPISHNPIGITKPPRKPQFGDLSYLSIASHPYFDYYVHSKTKLFAKKPEYQYLHQLPAELLQDIEAEPFDLPNVSDQENVNEFRRVYDDFYTRTRIYAPITGKKRVPPTRPYVLFLMLYDLYKREAKRLALHEFEGYSPSMLERLHKTSKYSAERQLYTLMFELLEQKSIVANDVLSRMVEIMTDLANPYSTTAKALHVLKPLSFEI